MFNDFRINVSIPIRIVQKEFISKINSFQYNKPSRSISKRFYFLLSILLFYKQDIDRRHKLNSLFNECTREQPIFSSRETNTRARHEPRAMIGHGEHVLPHEFAAANVTCARHRIKGSSCVALKILTEIVTVIRDKII